MFPNGCGCFNVFHGCCLHLHHGNLTFPTCRLANSIGNCCVSLMISDSWMFLEDGQITVWYSSRLERKRDIPGVFSRFFSPNKELRVLCSSPSFCPYANPVPFNRADESRGTPCCSYNMVANTYQQKKRIMEHGFPMYFNAGTSLLAVETSRCCHF